VHEQLVVFVNDYAAVLPPPSPIVPVVPWLARGQSMRCSRLLSPTRPYASKAAFSGSLVSWANGLLEAERVSICPSL
jgi:hypothetical protein